MGLPRFELNTKSVIFLGFLAILAWNLGCCLFAAVAGSPLHLYARSNGSTWCYVVAVSWFGLPTNLVAPLSGEWWRIVVANLAFMAFLILPVYQRAASIRKADERWEARKRQKRAPVSRTRDTKVKRIHLVSEERVQERKTNCKYAAAVVAALMVLMLALGSFSILFFSFSFALGGIAAIMAWVLASQAHRTVLVCGEEELCLETDRRPIWTVRWDQIVGWHRETRSHGEVKCIVLRCDDGSTRRINVGWLNEEVWFFADILSELRERTGKQDETPIEKDAPVQPRNRDQEAMVSLILVGIIGLAVAIVTISALMR